MKKLFIANWKSSMSARDAVRFIKEFKNKNSRSADVAIAASFVHLPFYCKEAIKAAQDVSMHGVGAFTGDVSAAQLAELGVMLCLVGHSERRIYHAETEDELFAKIERLLAAKITPVLCVGENSKQRKAGKTNQVLKNQLSVLKDVSDASAVIIAYEPVWAISTFQTGKNKVSATEQEIIEAHLTIKKLLKTLIGSKAKNTKILYGGSVTPENSASILSISEVDGVLVGGASTNAKSFMKIINNLK